MNVYAKRNGLCMLFVMIVLTACASLETLIEQPRVSLRNVQVEKLAVNEQSFLLSFDVTNPNPFPLPVTSIDYGVELDGHRLASGAATSEFTVGAGSDGEFAISVNVNLLQTAPELLFIVRESVWQEIPYTLEGRLGVDIPYVQPIKFKTNGLISLQAAAN
jgi:LEA14-like dessication related protein